MADADFDLSKDEVSALAGISMFFSALSLLGSGFIIACYLRFRELRMFTFKLVFMLSVNDFINQVGDFLQPSAAEVLTARTADNVDALCMVQAVTESFFELSSVLWTTSIAFTLYMMFFKRKTIKEVEGYFNMYMLFCWGVPLILTIIPGAMDMYGGAGAWCWIKPGHVEWRFLQFYIPLWLAVSFNTYVYVVVIRTTNKGARMARASGSEAAKEMADRMVASVNRLRWYPMILLIVWGFASINRVYESIAEENVFWLTVLQKSFSSLQGLLNAFAYGMSDKIRQALVRDMPFLRRLCPGCCKTEESDVEWANNPVNSTLGNSSSPSKPRTSHTDLHTDGTSDGDL